MKSREINYNRDYNLIDTSIRELIEESGYNKDIASEEINVVNTVDNLGINNIANLHTIGVNTYIFLGKRNNDPKIYDIDYAGEREEGSLKANVSEIGHLEWVRIDELNQENGIISYNNIALQTAYSTAVNNVTKHIRESEIKKSSDGKIESRESISAWTGKYTQQFTEVGKSPSNQHKIHKCFAEEIGKSKIVGKDPIIIYQNCMNK